MKEDRDAIKIGLEELLLKEFDRELADRLHDEIKLNNAAKMELKDLEKQLLKPPKMQYYSGTI